MRGSLKGEWEGWWATRENAGVEGTLGINGRHPAGHYTLQLLYAANVNRTGAQKLQTAYKHYSRVRSVLIRRGIQE